MNDPYRNDPYNNDPNYPPRYWSRQPPLGATAYTTGHQAATQPPQQGHASYPGQAHGLSPIPEQQRGGAQPTQGHYANTVYAGGHSTSEQGMFEMSPIPGDVPSPYQPASAHTTPPTPPHAGPYVTPPLPAGYTRSAPQAMPGVRPPAYNPVQGYFCRTCRLQVPDHLAAEHKRSCKPRPIGLGFGDIQPRRDKSGGQGGQGGQSGSSSSTVPAPTFFARR